MAKGESELDTTSRAGMKLLDCFLERGPPDDGRGWGLLPFEVSAKNHNPSEVKRDHVIA